MPLATRAAVSSDVVDLGDAPFGEQIRDVRWPNVGWLRPVEVGECAVAELYEAARQLEIVADDRGVLQEIDGFDPVVGGQQRVDFASDFCPRPVIERFGSTLVGGRGCGGSHSGTSLRRSDAAASTLVIASLAAIGDHPYPAPSASLEQGT